MVDGDGEDPASDRFAPDPFAPDLPPDAGPATRARSARFRLLRRHRDPKRRDRALGFRLFFVLLVFAIIAAGFSLKLRPMTLPVWAVAEVEARMNRMVDVILPRAGVSLGGMELMLDDSWQPVLRLQDMALLQDGQDTLLALPETVMALDGKAMLKGQLAVRRLQIDGAHVDLTRDRDGRLNLSWGDTQTSPIGSLSDLFDRIDKAMVSPELSRLDSVAFGALSLSVTDLRANRAWDLGDGRLVVQNREGEIAAELAISFLGASTGSPRAQITAVAAKGTGTARISAEVQDIPARDLAAQHSVLGWLGAIDAPISADLALTVNREGIAALAGKMSLGAGALKPTPAASPVAFSRAGLRLAYSADTGRLALTDIAVESASLRVKAQGQAFFAGYGWGVAQRGSDRRLAGCVSGAVDL